MIGAWETRRTPVRIGKAEGVYFCRGEKFLWVAVLVVCTLCLCGASVGAGAHQSAEELVRDTSDRTLAAIKAQEEEIRNHPKLLYELVTNIVAEHFDFDRMSRWVLGRYVRVATPEQRGRFRDEFRTLLIRTYATALLEHSRQAIRYLPVHMAEDSREVTVRTELDQPGGAAIPIHYRMYLAASGWKVIDVSVDGISLVANYRSTFSTQIQDKGLEAVIKDLAAHNRRNTG